MPDSTTIKNGGFSGLARWKMDEWFSNIFCRSRNLIPRPTKNVWKSFIHFPSSNPQKTAFFSDSTSRIPQQPHDTHNIMSPTDRVLRLLWSGDTSVRGCAMSFMTRISPNIAMCTWRFALVCATFRVGVCVCVASRVGGRSTCVYSQRWNRN